jgi:hypothetical protein
VSGGKSSTGAFFSGLFRLPKGKRSESKVSTGQMRSLPATNTGRIICFRVDDDLDRRIARELRLKSCSRSDFIRNAIERVLTQDGEERLRVAHSAIDWK